jgi:hypothetical protein
LHLSAAAVDMRQWGEAIRHMDAARRLAPQWDRVQPLGHVVLAQLVEHWPSRRPVKLTDLIRHYTRR